MTYQAIKPRTFQGELSYGGDTSLTTTKQNDQSISRRRGSLKTMFSGGFVYNANGSSQNLTVLLSVTDGSNTFKLARQLVLTGDTHVWTEEEFGIVLENDEQMTITTAETLRSGDSMVFVLNTKDTG